MTNNSKSTFLWTILIGSACVFVYLPMVLMLVFSFNDSQFSSMWHGFTTKWYMVLWNNHEVWSALLNSLVVSLTAVSLALLFCTLFIFYVPDRYLARYGALFYLNTAVPEIVLAVGLLTLFVSCNVPLGFTTLVAVHTVLGFGYVYPILYNRYREIDYRILEAAYDLGATHFQAMRFVILPLLRPALVSAGFLMFVLSFDDFLLSFFCSGSSFQTLPVYLYSLVRSGTSPVVNALASVLFVLSSLGLGCFFLMSSLAHQERQ